VVQLGAHISKVTIRARHLSAQTPKDYINIFNRFTAFLGEDLLIEDISHKQIETSLNGERD
jgi:hypothetical protein